MFKLNLKMNPSVDPQFTADDWDLYDTDNRNDVARALNIALKLTINSGSTVEQVREKMDDVMGYYASAGASDTEPYALLDRILEEVYG